MRDFFRPVATLLTGTVLAQVLIYASRPVLTRLFTPDEFGVLSFYTGVIAVIASLSGGKFEDALMLPRDPQRAWSLAAASILLSCLAAVVLGALSVFRHVLQPLLSNPEAARFLILAPLSVVFVGVARTSDAWLTRTQHFVEVARGRVAHSAALVPAQLAGGIGKVGAVGLVGGLLLGQATQSIYYGLRAIAAARSESLSIPSLRSIFDAAWRYRRFALFGAPGTALNTASVQLPALVLLFFFDASVLGNYGVGYAVLAVPMTLLGSAVAQVFYVRAAEAIRTGQVTDLTESVFRRLVALGLFPILCVSISGPELFRFVFGSSWSDAGLYASYLSPWVFLVFISSPLSRLFDLLEKQKELLLFNVLLFVVRGSALLAGGKSDDAKIAILLFGVAGALMWLLHTGWTLHLAAVRAWRAGAILGRYLAFAAAPFSIVVVSKLLDSDLWASAGVVLAGAIYYLVLLRSDPELLNVILDRPSNEAEN